MNETPKLRQTESALQSELEYIQKKTNEINLRLSKEASLTGKVEPYKFQQAQKAIDISKSIAYEKILISEGIEWVR